jgi:hypothetical protein
MADAASKDDRDILTNRQKSRTAKRGLFWCGGCDGNLVGQTGKCKACGYRENRRKTRAK